MNIAQRIKQLTYPALMMMAKWLGTAKKGTNTKAGVTPPVPFYSLCATSTTGEVIAMAAFEGKHVLLVNTASHCGYTAQYTELEQLQKQYADSLVIIGFPANDFGGQEPGSDAEIAEFCRMYYDVSFTVAKKASVIGPQKQPVYQWLTDPAQNGWNKYVPTWNFCKYLVNPKGNLIAFYPATVSPLDPSILSVLKK